MKTIIAGSREITDYKIVKKAIKKSGFKITEVVSGKARGVDTLGEKWAKEHNIPIKKFPADWEKYGRSAGPIRNQEMAKYADALIAIPLPEGKGTQHMIKTARKDGIKVFVYIIK